MIVKTSSLNTILSFIRGRLLKLSAAVMLLVLLISALAGVYTQLPALKSPYVITDDVMQHTYWMDRFHDSELFKDDIYVQFDSYLLPVGFKVIYYFLTFFANAIIVGKALGIFLYMLAGIYMYRIGCHIFNKSTGFLAALMFTCFPPHVDTFSCGLPRAFAFPLLIIFLFYFMKEKYLRCLPIMLLQALIYPSVFITSSIVMGTALLTTPRKLKKFLTTKDVFRYLIFFLLSLLLVYLCKWALKPDFMGEYDLVQRGGGNHNIPLMARTFSKVLNRELLYVFLPFSICSVVTDILRKRYDRTFAYKSIVALFSSGFLIYLLSDLISPLKFMRPFQYSLPLFSCLCISVGMGFPLRVRKKYLKYPVLGTFIIALVLFNGDDFRKGIALSVDRRRGKKIYEYIATLPKDVVIAGDPNISDYISTFSRRKTFLKGELSYTWFSGYTDIITRRIVGFFRAYYSPSEAEIYAFLKDNDIDYMIVDRAKFTRSFLQKKRFFYPPFNRFIVNYTAGRNDFFLYYLKRSRTVREFYNERVYLIASDERSFSDKVIAEYNSTRDGR